MEREVPNFNFMDIKQQFVFLMINEDINIISFISDIVFENFQMQKRWFDMWSLPLFSGAYCLHRFKYMHYVSFICKAR
jgi:hypothetical protein